MAALAVAAPGAAGPIGMLGLDGENRDACLVQPEIELAAARFPQAVSIAMAASRTVAAECRRRERQRCAARSRAPRVRRARSR